MRSAEPFPWDVAPAEARALQERLRGRVECRDRLGPVRAVAGADAAFDRAGRGYAAVAAFAWPGLAALGEAGAEGPVGLAYLPGLLAFREGPLLVEALARLRCAPDLLLFDAHGVAHPRRCGLASLLGVLLDTPSVGVAKRPLVGTGPAPPDRPGVWRCWRDGGEVVGAALRTRAGARPVYVSVGHRVSLETAVAWAWACCDGTRLPRPLREADRLARRGRARGAGVEC